MTESHCTKCQVSEVWKNIIKIQDLLNRLELMITEIKDIK